MKKKEDGLRWKDPHQSFFGYLQDLYSTETLTDVTVSCDGRVFEAHKLVLCAFSSFFRNILTQRQDKHPIIFLKDVDAHHLDMILHLMYKGEIQVPRDDLDPLIRTAKSLQVSLYFRIQRYSTLEYE
jgi:hypothetical protein